MIPKRTLTATIEISTGKITITSVPPSFTGETNACDVVINLYNGGSAYSPSGVTAGMYLYWPGQQQMTAETPLMISGSQLTGSMPAVMMARAGNPLLVVQLQDSEGLIVAAAAPITIFETRGGVILDTRAPSPSEIIYVGRAPYVNPANNHWMQWDNDLARYVDSGVSAVGTGVASVDGVLPDSSGNVAIHPITNSEIDEIMAS